MSVCSVGAPLARRHTLSRELLAALVLTLALSAAAGAGEWSGYVALEARGFACSPGAAGQADDDLVLSASFQPEYYRQWNDGDQTFTFTGFLRYDGEDSERTHADVRELTWQRVGRRWERSAGIRKIFWGVTESQHLVDVINQTDLVEDLDGEEKLGQPMVQLALARAWGTLDLFLLPGFEICPGIMCDINIIARQHGQTPDLVVKRVPTTTALSCVTYFKTAAGTCQDRPQ